MKSNMLTFKVICHTFMVMTDTNHFLFISYLFWCVRVLLKISNIILYHIISWIKVIKQFLINFLKILYCVKYQYTIIYLYLSNAFHQTGSVLNYFIFPGIHIRPITIQKTVNRQIWIFQSTNSPCLG